MSGPALANTEAQLTPSLSLANQHEDPIMTYAMVVNHLLMLYATNGVAAEAYNTIPNCRQALMAPWDYYQKLLNLTFR